MATPSALRLCTRRSHTFASIFAPFRFSDVSSGHASLVHTARFLHTPPKHRALQALGTSSWPCSPLSGTRWSHSSASINSESSPSAEPSSASDAGVPAAPAEEKPLDPLEPRLSLTFTCTADSCTERSTHTFTRRAYERGIVLVQCPGCKNRHLIADHIGWFKESTEDGKLRTVEDLLRARGEKVRRGRLDAGGVVEYSD
ncbi:hypothetical protein HGRIS_004858 [Hohenbuehelia grisea]|uniref:DNL-type domain-containing protein n=1 Tax=Hohenbuehelia grisea TaxID=104357 RepID=A0ABR3JD67_9AGAR